MGSFDPGGVGVSGDGMPPGLGLCSSTYKRVTEIDAFIRRGLLNGETRNDPGAIIDALYAFLDDTLGATP